MKELDDYIKKTEKDLKELIKLIPKLKKIDNSIIVSEIEQLISNRIILQARIIKELKECKEKEKVK